MRGDGEEVNIKRIYWHDDMPGEEEEDTHSRAPDASIHAHMLRLLINFVGVYRLLANNVPHL